MLRELTLGDIQVQDDADLGFTIFKKRTGETLVWLNERGSQSLYDWLSEKLAMEMMTGRVAYSILSKSKPSDMFAGEFYDLRERIKKLKSIESEKLRVKMEKTLLGDLRGKGLTVEGGLSLGQYRGSKFVTSAKLKVGRLTQEQAGKLLRYLQQKYSPKFKLKSFAEDGIATYNIR